MAAHGFNIHIVCYALLCVITARECIRLLKEDYIKLRGHLFFRLISTIVDDDESVRMLAEFCITNLLLVKDSTLFTSVCWRGLRMRCGWRRHSSEC